MLIPKILEFMSKKPVVRVHDLRKYLGAKDKSLNALLYYMCKRGMIKRIFKGAYTTAKDIKVIATWLYMPSYISLEYSLFVRGLLEQVIDVLQVITSQRLKYNEINILGSMVRYYRIPSRLMFGFTHEYSDTDEEFYYFIAHPEKAILDMIYLGKNIRTYTIHWDNINKDRILKYSKYYPKWVREKVDTIIFQLT